VAGALAEDFCVQAVLAAQAQQLVLDDGIELLADQDLLQAREELQKKGL